MLRNRWAERADLNRCILRSRHLTGSMRIFGSIILSQSLLVRASQSQTLECAGVRAQLVGDQQFGCETLLLEQLAHQPQRRPTIAPALNSI
jgi:hypothetical protein